MSARALLTATYLLLATCALSLDDPSFGSSTVEAPNAFLYEPFKEDWQSRWTSSKDEKYSGVAEVRSAKHTEDPGLVLPKGANHYGISTNIKPAVDPSQGLVFQYEVTLEDGLTCGGAYMKLLMDDGISNLADLGPETPYSIMFGPDKCGATNKVHTIIRHKNPNSKEYVERHLKKDIPVETNSEPHLYALQLNPSNNTFEVRVDGEARASGSLYDEFDPPFQPPKEVDDPNDTKPDDWVDEPEIPDPNAEKPADWDEDAPEYIPDPEATKPEGWLEDEPVEVVDTGAKKPEEWDDEEDGKWEPPLKANPKCADAPGCGEWKPPLIPNPNYKGKWTPPLISNPEYKGEWKPRKINNPDYFEDTSPLRNIGNIGAAAVEVWTMDGNILFDNILLTRHRSEADKLASTTFDAKREHVAQKAAEEGKTGGGGTRKALQEYTEKAHWLVIDAIRAVLSLPYVNSLEERVGPLVDGLEDMPQATVVGAAVSVLGLPVFLLLPMLFLLLKRRKRSNRRARHSTRSTATSADHRQEGGSEAASNLNSDKVETLDEEKKKDDGSGSSTRSRRTRREQ